MSLKFTKLINTTHLSAAISFQKDLIEGEEIDAVIFSEEYTHKKTWRRLKELFQAGFLLVDFFRMEERRRGKTYLKLLKITF